MASAGVATMGSPFRLNEVLRPPFLFLHFVMVAVGKFQLLIQRLNRSHGDSGASSMDSPRHRFSIETFLGVMKKSR